jgi:hypothetical protein
MHIIHSSPPARIFIAVLCISWFLTSCAPTRFVKPLDKGETAITAAFGGPLILYDNTTIPMPLTSLAVGHGFDSGLTGFAGFHTTALLFGVFQTDIGVVKQLLKQQGWIPGITVSPVANLMIDKWEGKFSFFPQLDANAYWNYPGKPHYVYIGISNWFDLNTTRSEGDPQTTHWFPIIQLGNTMVTRKWAYTLELKYAPKINYPVVVEYQGLGQATALGVYIGVTRKLFTGKNKKLTNKNFQQ